MNSTTTHPHRTKKSSVYLILMASVSLGLAIGVVGYLVANWLFNFGAAELDQIALGSGKSNSNTSSMETFTTKFDRFFTEDLRKSELHQAVEELSKLSPQQLKDLTTKSSTQSWSPRLHTIQEILVELLVQNSPSEALARLEQFPEHRRHSLIHLVFTHWSTSNFEEALSAATDLSRSDERVAIRAIFEERSDLSNQDLSLTTNKFDLESEFDAWEQEKAIYGLLEQDPSTAFNRLLTDGIEDSLQRELYQQVVEKWFEYDGLNILTALDDVPFISGISSDLFDLVVGHDRRAALEFITNVDESRRNGLGYQVLDNWSRYDTEAALQAALDLPKSTFRNWMLNSVVRDWAEKAPNSVMDRILEIPRLYRADAVSAVASQLAVENPKNALEQIEVFRSIPGSYVDRSIQTILRSWSEDAPDFAVDWIQSNIKEGSRNRIEALTFVIYQYALIDPERAMTIAVEEIKPENSWTGLERQVISALLGADRVDTAIGLLDQIQDDSLLVSSATEVGTELVKANRMDDSFLVADLLTEDQRFRYFYSVTVGLMDTRSSDVLELIEKLPSEELQTGVVEQLMNGRTLERYFNAEQIETLRSYVSE